MQALQYAGSILSTQAHKINANGWGPHGSRFFLVYKFKRNHLDFPLLDISPQIEARSVTEGPAVLVQPGQEQRAVAILRRQVSPGWVCGKKFNKSKAGLVSSLNSPAGFPA